MATLIETSALPATIETGLLDAGLLDVLPPISERLDARAFAILQDREEAEALLMRDRLCDEGDTAWTALVVEAMVEFLVWQSAPSGRISTSDLDWFLALAGDAPSPSVPALLFALVRELNEAPERLVALALRLSKNRLAVMH